MVEFHPKWNDNAIFLVHNVGYPGGICISFFLCFITKITQKDNVAHSAEGPIENWCSKKCFCNYSLHHFSNCPRVKYLGTVHNGIRSFQMLNRWGKFLSNAKKCPKYFEIFSSFLFAWSVT